MATIDIDHADAEELIDAKTNTDQLNGVNISVKMDDYFMDRVREILDENTKAIPQDVEVALNEINNGSRLVARKDRDALLDKIANNQAKYAEPGILFWSRVMEQPDSVIYSKEGMRPVSTNPC